MDAELKEAPINWNHNYFFLCMRVVCVGGLSPCVYCRAQVLPGFEAGGSRDVPSGDVPGRTYVSHAIQMLIGEGTTFVGVHVPSFACVNRPVRPRSHDYYTSHPVQGCVDVEQCFWMC